MTPPSLPGAKRPHFGIGTMGQKLLGVTAGSHGLGLGIEKYAVLPMVKILASSWVTITI